VFRFSDQLKIVIAVYKRKTVESTDFRSILKISGAKSKVRLEKWQYCIKVPLEKCRKGCFYGTIGEVDARVVHH
jgi:hypothetical protein